MAIFGVGNCASALVQGIYYYGKQDYEKIPGLIHTVIGGYRLEDIEFVLAVDIDKRKVGKDLSEAIFSGSNCTVVFESDIPNTGVIVLKGQVLDGICEHTRDMFLVDEYQPEITEEILIKLLKESGVEIAVNYMPVGSTKATKFYARCCMKAGVGFINAMPVFIASDKRWAKAFERRGIPVLGDDVKSQVGATIVHRTLTKLFMDRGIKLLDTYQLNWGGNSDFKNMLSRSRLRDKKISKTSAVRSQIVGGIDDDNIHVGPSDYVPFLKDQKICEIKMRGEKFGGVPLLLDLKLEVIDSPNSGGVIVDAIRLMKLALDRGIGGPLYSASAYLMKHPTTPFDNEDQYCDEVAREMVEEYIRGDRER